MNNRSFAYAITSAGLFGISPPLAKLMLKDFPPVFLAGILYLGAFLGLGFFWLGKVILRQERKIYFEKTDSLWLAGAILCGGVLGPISLMLGLNLVTGFTASLLLNLEATTTALIAFFLFNEFLGKRFWIALFCMSVAGIFLSWDPRFSKFNIGGTALILSAMIFWGLDNNFTRKISDKEPVFIAMLKGLFGGIISIGIALIMGLKLSLSPNILPALFLGAFSYGLSLVFFIKSLQGLGSARTGAFFSLAPFIGAVVSILALNEWIGWVMIPGGGFMVIGVFLILSETHSHTHKHERITHQHYHWHDDDHHLHPHNEKTKEPHIHPHLHDETIHLHSHSPDTHHRHNHPN